MDTSYRLNLNWNKLLLPGTVLVAFWILAVLAWRSSGYLQALFFFGYIGTAVGGGLGLYTVLPKKHKPWGRRFALFLVGAFLFGFGALYGAENMQIEGLFFGLLAGISQAAVTHYLIAKIFGPILFGRIWCGWACWTVMVLDLLPFQRSPGRLPGKWGWLRYAHFAASLGLVLLLWFGFRSPQAAAGAAAVRWFVIGNAFYYLLGIGLAFLLKDNRAFCKYVCPITALLKLTTRLSLLKIRGDPLRCNGCNACVKTCPMDIRIPDYIRYGQRVLSTECSLCQTCLTVCPRDALKLSAGLDLGGKDLLYEWAVYEQ